MGAMLVISYDNNTSIPSLIFMEPQRLPLSIPTVSGPILPSVNALSSASSSYIEFKKGIIHCVVNRVALSFTASSLNNIGISECWFLWRDENCCCTQRKTLGSEQG